MSLRFKEYPQRIPSNIPWLGNVPRDWRLCRLKYYLSINPSYKECGYVEPDASIPFFAMESISDDGYLSVDTEKPFKDASGSYTYFRNDDVVVAKVTPCFENGKGALVKNLDCGFGFGTTELVVLRPSKDLSNKFLYYISISNEVRHGGTAFMTGAGGLKRVPDDFYLNLVWPIPSYEEQEKIAYFLDCETAKIDELIRKQEKLIELLNEEMQSITSRLLVRGLSPDCQLIDSGVDWLGSIPKHWEVKKFKFFASLIQEKTEEKTNVVALENIESWSGKLIETESKFEADGISFEKDDVLFGKLRPYLAKVLLAKNSGQAFGDILVFRAKKGINPSYLFRTILNGEFIKLVNSSTYGAKMPRANWDFIGNVKIAVPPLDEQIEIVNKINSKVVVFEKLTAKAKQSIGLLKEHRESLISAAVTGKIDVRSFA